MYLQELLKNCRYPYTIPDTAAVCDKKPDITAFTYDSRKAAPGFAFVCLSGARMDGHDFARSAYDGGCRVFFAEHALDLPKDAVTVLFDDTRAALPYLSDTLFEHPQRELTVIGVTGTKGKTTIANLIGSTLNAAGYPCGVIGTIGITYGGDWYPTVNSTPESYILHETFRKMADNGVKYVVMEVSSQSVFRHRIDGIQYDIAIFSNLSEDHIGGNEHPTFEHYKDCKKQLFSQCNFAVFNADDPYSAEFIAACKSPYVTCSLQTDADFRGGAVEPYSGGSIMGIRFPVANGTEEHTVSLRIPGAFNAENALEVIAVLRQLGLSFEEILPPLSLATVPGRFEILDVLPDCTVIIDYAHNEVSLKNLLTTVRAYQPKRMVCLYGSVGGRTTHRRKELAEVSGDLADFCIITTDNPDFEPPEQIIDEIASYYTEDSAPHISIVDRKEAILYALHHAEPGDALLFCGKGHETYQLVNGIHVPFSEKEIILEETAKMRRTEQPDARFAVKQTETEGR